MNTYLLKKLVSPNNEAFICTSWNKSSGYLACGGEEGLLKIFQIDLQGFNEKNQLFFLNVNQIHTKTITALAWSEKTQKLASADESGLVVIWKCFGDYMKEELINDYSSQAVSNIGWSRCGQRICMSTSNGNITVISSEGTVIWSQEHLNVVLFQWFPSGTSLLVGLRKLQLVVLDRRGKKIEAVSLVQENTVNSEISAIDWYNGENGWTFEMCPTLAVCLNNGICKLLKNEQDEDWTTIETEMAISHAKWNRDGSIIAIGGTFLDSSANKIVNLLNFYSLQGKHVNSIILKDGNLNSLSWNDDNSVIAAALDGKILFISTKHHHNWGQCSDSVVYAYPLPFSFSYIVRFWSKATKIVVKKLVNNVEHVQTHQQNCCIVAKHEDTLDHSVTIYNSIGNPLGSSVIPFTPRFCQISSSHVVVASAGLLYLWEYRTLSTGLATVREVSVRDGQTKKFYNADDGMAEIGDLRSLPRASKNEITCMCLSNHLCIGRINGSVGVYKMPDLAVLADFTTSGIPTRMQFSVNSENLAIINSAGVLTVIHKTASPQKTRTIASRTGVWDVKWAEDNDDLLATAEKSKLYILRGGQPEEVFDMVGHIHSFANLRVTTINLDRLSVFPDYPNDNLLHIYELKSIRIVRSLNDSAEFETAKTYVMDNSHRYLWEMLGEAALKKLDLEISELAYTICQNYSYIQFIKTLRHIQDGDLKLAKVMTLFKEYKKAEEIYLSKDRKDLAIKLWRKTGNYFQVNKMLGTNYDNSEVLRNNRLIGNFYADSHKWKEALRYLRLSNDESRIVECFYATEDFEGLKTYMTELPNGHSSLSTIAEIFKKSGMYLEAVEAYQKVQDLDKAIDACIRGNQWRCASTLARRSDSVDITSLLSRNIDSLVNSGQLFEAISLCQEAGNYADAAGFVVEFADKFKEKCRSLVTVKKLYVLAGLLFKEQQSNDVVYGGKGDKLRDFSNPWTGAEAYHFLILTNNFIRQGNYENAFWSAYRLLNYESTLKSENVHALIALCACFTNRYKICSCEFMLLEKCGVDHEEYKDLSFRIFSGEKGKIILNSDTHDLREDLMKPVCYLTGKAVKIESCWQCNVCKHCADQVEMRNHHFCPLCHCKREEYAL